MKDQFRAAVSLAHLLFTPADIRPARLPLVSRPQIEFCLGLNRDPATLALLFLVQSRACAHLRRRRKIATTREQQQQQVAGQAKRAQSAGPHKRKNAKFSSGRRTSGAPPERARALASPETSECVARSRAALS